MSKPPSSLFVVEIFSEIDHSVCIDKRGDAPMTAAEARKLADESGKSVLFREAK